MYKKHLFLCLLMAILVPLAMFGQEELTVFEGTGTCREAPMYVYYFDDYTRAQTVYPATVLEDMVGATITAIKLYTTSQNIPYTTVSTFDIYLTEVNATSISSFVDRSNATTVYSGTNEFVATDNGGEITITFITPYIYHGGNLLFGCDNTTDSGCKSIYFCGQSKTGASISGYNSSAGGTINPTQRNFIPTTTFIYTSSCPRPVDLAVTLNGSDATIATINWTETGEAIDWVLQIATNATFTEGIQEFEVSDNPTKNLTGLIPETRYYARVKALCGGGNESNWSKAINYRPSNTIPLTLNEGTATNEYVPVYGYYAEQYQKSEFIIPASTEGLAAMTDGTINQMTFYLSTPASESWGNAQFQVFMKEVLATGFSSENYGNFFYGINDATIVYEGPLDGTQSTMVIDFTTNYHYNGGNLLVGVYETTKGTWKRAYFAGNTSTGGSLRKNNSSSLGSITTGEIEDFLPKTTFNYLSVIIPKPANLQAYDITSSSATISWTAAANNVTSYQYKYKTEGGEWTALESTTSNSVSLSGLADFTSYTFQVKAIYGDGESDFASITFSTKQIPVLVDLEHPFVDGFEGEHCEWELLNGTLVNRWVFGVAVNHGDVHSLYISNNGGVTNVYTINSSALVYASKSFTLEQGMYNFTYDWRANGEVSGNTPYDYLRVALIPDDVELIPYTDMPDGFGYNQLSEGWIALDGGTQLNLSEDWNTYSTDNEVSTAGIYKMVFIWRNDNSAGNNPPAAIDNIVINRVGCPMPTELSYSNITDTSVTLNWTANGSEEAWEIEYRAEGEDTWQMVTAYVNPYLLEGLAELTAYEVRVRAVCSSATTTTLPITFTTKQTPIVVDSEHPFADNFEGERCGWELVNGDITNQWVWGSAANNGGDKALYISNDNGLTNAYDISKKTMVYAAKIFTMEKGAYYFEYDWRANGEVLSTGTPFDYLRVALVPADTEPVADTLAPSVPSGHFYDNLPSGWIALDGGGQLSQSTDWVSYSGAANITTAGNYKVVFAWRSDNSQGVQPPAAIDNFSIIKLPCTLPTELAAYAMFTTAELTWTELGYAVQWNLQWRLTGTLEWNTVYDLDETSYSLTDLTPDTEYEFRVQPDCTDEYWTDSYTFTTHCEAYDVTQQTTIIEGFENDVFPPDCWESLHTYTQNWSRNTNVKHAGSACAYSGYYGPIYLNMPVINISQEAAYAELSFWSRVGGRSYYTGGTSGNHDGLSIVKVSNDYGRTWTQLWCPTIEELPAEATWERISLDLTNYKNQDILIVFEYQGNNAHGWYVDDVAVTVYDKVFLGGSAEDATAWFNAGNWQPDGVPTLEQNVYITAPAIIAESSNAAQANTIDFAEQGSLTIADGGQLMVNNEVAAIVKKNIAGYGNSEGGYHLVANPLSNAVSPVNAGLITAGSGYDLYDWEYSASDGLEWRNYKENTFNLYNGWGVLYANESDVELNFNGTVKANNVPETKTISYSSGYEFGGWRLYGNPFVCDAYLNTESTEMAFYRMNATGDGFETATGAIHPLEGFFVQVTASGQTFTISREAPAQRGQLNMNLSRNNKRLDNAIVIFGEGQNLDKWSFRENSSKVYMPMEDKDCAAVFTTGMGEIPVNFKAEENGTYTLGFTNQDVVFSYLHLIDNLTGNDVDLLANPSYCFEAKSTDYASRFKLVFSVCGDADGDNAPFAFINNGNIVIIGTDADAVLQIVDMTGRVLVCRDASHASAISTNGMAPGVYVLRLINGDDVKTQKIVVK